MELQKKFNIRKDEPEEPVEEKPKARPSKMAFLQKERNKHMMRDFEKQTRFQEDQKKVTEIIDESEAVKPDLITEEELAQMQRKMEAEQQEFMSIKKALQEMGETGTTKEEELERFIG